MIRRHLASSLKQAAEQYPVVTVTGPRQSGKTTLLRHQFTRHAYVSLEAPDIRAFALEDPRGFLGQFEGPVILDEAQQAPALFSYIQTLVDEDKTTGRFILSGSQNFLLLKRISQSLAGRSRIAHLLPLSLAELNSREAPAIDHLGAEVPRGNPYPGDWTKIATRGFYPRIHDRELDANDWLSQYFQTYLQRDVRDLAQVGDLEAFSRFVALCAGRCGQLLNLSSLGNDCGISHDTARRWLSVLEASFVTFRLQPYHVNFNKRLTKSPKLYFVDTGLLCYLLRIAEAKQLASHALRGAVFENLVIAELLKAYYHSAGQPRIFFWRDHRGNEVDLIIETTHGPLPVEIKSGVTVASDYFKGLSYWRKLSGSDSGLLVYGGDESFRRSGTIVCSWRQWC